MIHYDKPLKSKICSIILLSEKYLINSKFSDEMNLKGSNSKKVLFCQNKYTIG